MNTYLQDETIPIYISLQYGLNFMKFPINPEHLKVERSSESVTEDIEGLGEIAIPQKPRLARVEISSFFWHQNNLTPSSFYVAWLRKWQDSRKPANLIVTRLNYSMQVICESFSYDTRAGEEKDVYFDLRLTEYRPYKAKKIKDKEVSSSVLSKIQQAVESAVPPVLVDIPRPTRSSVLKKAFGNVYEVCPRARTMVAIARLVMGDSGKWKELYDENKEVIGDAWAGKLEDGQKLTLPKSWTSGGGS